MSASACTWHDYLRGLASLIIDGQDNTLEDCVYVALCRSDDATNDLLRLGGCIVAGNALCLQHIIRAGETATPITTAPVLPYRPEYPPWVAP
jgi:hypothetical protein